MAIFASSSTMVRTLEYLLRKVEREKFPEITNTRIRGMWGDNQFDNWNADFLRNPSAPGSLVDVVLMTHFVQAGLSIETHYKIKVLLFPITFINFRMEWQLSQRLRWNDQIFETSYAFLQTGKKILRETNPKLINEDNHSVYE